MTRESRIVQNIEITDYLKSETTAWADEVMEMFKVATLLEKTYLRWGDPLMYTMVGDAWIDECWRIETAKYLFEQQDKIFDGLGGIPALKILTFHYPEPFQEIALGKINKWYREQGLHDAEDWLNIAALTDPEHP